jgi:hypothetical protein
MQQQEEYNKPKNELDTACIRNSKRGEVFDDKTIKIFSKLCGYDFMCGRFTFFAGNV